MDRNVGWLSSWVAKGGGKIVLNLTDLNTKKRKDLAFTSDGTRALLDTGNVRTKQGSLLFLLCLLLFPPMLNWLKKKEREMDIK